MRWDALLEDLQAQFAAAELLAVEGQIADQSRLELSSVTVMDRLRGQLGLALRIRSRSGSVFSGVLRHVGSEWLVLETGSGAVMVPAAAIGTVDGMGRQTTPERSQVVTRMGIGTVFRAFARDRTLLSVQLFAGGAKIDGTIDRVGRDFLELAAVPLGEQRRTTRVAGVVLVPFGAVEAVLSRS
ncbi:hypothetical protein [Arthrobacter sp. H20]|uniref:hypothetical protein n=1 Tax=Arthrobacter sp. H20 TaxID=1267981 RepID=UPI00047A9D88|nr:hypothetical protein [Arthrobacter sp. H20]